MMEQPSNPSQKSSFESRFAAMKQAAEKATVEDEEAWQDIQKAYDLYERFGDEAMKQTMTPNQAVLLERIVEDAVFRDQIENKLERMKSKKEMRDDASKG